MKKFVASAVGLCMILNIYTVGYAQGGSGASSRKNTAVTIVGDMQSIPRDEFQTVLLSGNLKHDPYYTSLLTSDSPYVNLTPLELYHLVKNRGSDENVKQVSSGEQGKTLNVAYNNGYVYIDDVTPIKKSPETGSGTSITYNVSKKGVLTKLIMGSEGTEITVNAVFRRERSGRSFYNSLVSYDYTTALAPGCTSSVPIAYYDVQQSEGRLFGTAYVRMTFYSNFVTRLSLLCKSPF